MELLVTRATCAELDGEIQPLIARHYDEIVYDRAAQRLAVGYERYYKLEEAGALFLVQARDLDADNLLVGYVVQFEKERQLYATDALQESQAQSEFDTRMRFTKAIAENEIGSVIDSHAAKQKELALQDDQAVTEHAVGQALRSMQTRFGVGTVVATEAARGLAGGAATAARVLTKQAAIQQMADDAKLRVQRGLYAVAGMLNDQQMFRSIRGINLQTGQQDALGRVQLEGLRRSNRLTEANLRAGNDLDYQGMQLDQGQKREQMAFDINRQIQSQYLDLNLGVKAGTFDLNTKLADLDFQHGIDDARAALADAFRMENALIDQKNNVSAAVHRNAYAQAMSEINGNNELWRGVGSLSASLWQTSNGIAQMFPQPASTPASAGSNGGWFGGTANGPAWR